MRFSTIGIPELRQAFYSKNYLIVIKAMTYPVGKSLMKKLV